jgi:hypothetical protein
VTNCTLSGNQALTGGAIGSEGSRARTTLSNTVVANNADVNCNSYRTIEDGGGNLSYPDTTCPGINNNPMLGPLANWGGPTQTMGLRAGSAALDAANDATCAAVPVNNLDQRGITRPVGPHCDIGAFEGQLLPTFLPVIMR